MNHDVAIALVERFLATIPRHQGHGFAVNDEKTQEHDVAWLFFWMREDMLLRPSHRRAAMSGNFPVLVRKRDGAMFLYAVNKSLEQVLDELRNNRCSLPRAELDDVNWNQTPT